MTRAKPTRSPRKLWAFRLAALLLVLCVVETCSYVASLVLTRRGVVFRKLEGDYPQYLEEHDPVLGWPGRSVDRKLYDPVGARPSVAYPDPLASPPLISVYGDSFTYSSEVDDAHAWPDVLSQLVGARVNNFGVGGYGSDQALLRFETHSDDPARIVLLAHFTENILRNVNQYRDLLYRVGEISFKPRFIVDRDQLTLIPLPKISPADFEQFRRYPGRFLPYETFAPGRPEGPVRARFPYTLVMARACMNLRVVAKVTGEPWYARFYQPDHHSHGLAVTAGILQRFHDQALAHDQQPVLLIIPAGLDLDYYRRHDRWVYQPLVDLLHNRGLPVLDLGPELEQTLGDRPVTDIYSQLDLHNNEEGYRMIAQLVYEFLLSRDATRSRLPKRESDATQF